LGTSDELAPVDQPVRRRITGFHEDDDGDWVAELDCLHTQHVRHRPPFQDRPWVLTEAGRAEHLATELDCPLCDRAELPEGLVVERTAGPFDEITLPAGLLRAHRIPSGTWGRLRVLEGSVDFLINTDPPAEHHLDAGQTQPIPPDVSHELRPKGPVRLVVDFLRRP
jgi:tellurite resistance-related uncharacterized protein